MYVFHVYFDRKIVLYKALSQITGIGHKMALQNCERLGISRQARLQDISSFLLTRLNQALHHNFLTENEYRKAIQKRKDRHISISSYRGFRYIQALPCRGQRTHTNARTSRTGARIRQPYSSKRARA